MGYSICVDRKILESSRIFSLVELKFASGRHHSPSYTAAANLVELESPEILCLALKLIIGE